jgi:uncharacterized protein (TIGR02118 family)
MIHPQPSHQTDGERRTTREKIVGDENRRQEDLNMATAYKILLLMKRRPGMTVAAFRDYYENRHVPLCAKYISGLSRYIRRYINPLPHPETGPVDELPFDVITELWFDDEAVFKATVDYITTTIMPDEVVEDEKNLFDRTSFRIATVVECESDLSAAKSK